MKPIQRFNRGLSDKFVTELLSGRFASVLTEALRVALDVQIREDYLNFYYNGLSVLELSQHTASPCYRAQIHRNYLDGVELPCSLVPAGAYRKFDATGEFTDRFIRCLPMLLANAETYPRPERIVEQKIVRANCTSGSPVVFIDRQIQVHGTRKKADLVGMTAEGQFVVAEVKQGLDNSIQHLMDQIYEYYVVLSGPEGYLCEDIARSYRRVIEQKQSLGLLPLDIRPLTDRTEVVSLLVLYAYNPRSELLTRLRQASTGSSFPVALIMLPKGACTLPPATAWERLCPAR